MARCTLRVHPTLSKKRWSNTLGNLVPTHLMKDIKRKVKRPFIQSIPQPFPSWVGQQIVKIVSRQFIKRHSWLNVERTGHTFLQSSVILLQWRFSQPSQLELQILRRPFLGIISINSYPIWSRFDWSTYPLLGLIFWDSRNLLRWIIRPFLLF